MTLSPERELVAHDPLRPHYHFLPAANWMNDPNGLIHWRGVYHLFYQYNPHGPFWGTIHWGHASSSDLVHWQHHAIALQPGPEPYDSDGCWSGCMVSDAGTPTLLYTGKEQGHEWVCLARGDDRLQVWQKDPANPLDLELPAGVGAEGFRDPFVWREDDRWWMIIGSDLNNKGIILLYTSLDLIHWQYLYPLLTGDGTTGTMWECPNLLRHGDRAALALSAIPLERVVVFTGAYRQGVFSPVNQSFLDGGSSFYAPQIIQNAHDQWLLLAWLREEKVRDVPWAGTMSLPRILTLHDDDRIQMQPIPALQLLRYQPRAYTQSLQPGDVHPVIINQLGQWECEGVLTPATEGVLTLTLQDDEQDYITIHLDLTAQQAGMQLPHQPVDEWLLYHLNLDGAMHVHCFFDHSVLEVFVQQEQCFTKRVYPVSVTTAHLALAFQGIALVSLQLQMWDLHDARFQTAL
ncbi:MAG: glycoside hydrolase family 32 protein [Ktedonobacteraceae bacterium]